MRLTLRTLLAYLDDILPPSQAREIGAKVTDTPEASKLMQRIREVLKRRRVGAPALSGSGSGPDPNIVAEYLDNTLSPQTVIELEKICLSSDMHLAEVAGCHSILTLVLSEPVEVPEEMRMRIHALGQSTKPTPVRAPEKPASDEPLAHSDDILAQAPTAASASAHIQGLSGTMDVSEMADGIPDYLRQRSSWTKYAVAAAVSCGVGLWGASIYWDLLGSGHQVAPVAVTSVETPKSSQKAVPAQSHTPEPALASAENLPDKTPQKSTSPQEPQTPPGEVTAKPSPPEKVSGQPPETPQPQVAAVSSQDKSSEPSAPTQPVMIKEPAGEAGTEVVAVTVAPAAEKVPPAVVQPEITMLYTSGEGVALISSPMQPDWMVFPRRGIVHSEDILAVPAPYDASFTLSEGTGQELGADLRLAAETRMTRIAPKGLCRIGFELHRGSVMLSRSATSQAPIKVLVRAAGRDWQVELSHPGTVCGIQVNPPSPVGPPGREGKLQVTGGVLVVSGRVTLGLQGDTGEEFRAGQGWISWPIPGTPLQADSASGIPDWLTPEGVVLTPSARQIARTFEKEFALDRTVAGEIPPVIEDRQAKVSELAVKTCGLIGLYPDLIKGLRSDHEESRLAAIDYLREWLPTSPMNPQLLQSSLEQYYRDQDLTAVTRLLWGYTPADARDAEVSRQLVTWLGDDDVTIRELAFYHIFRLTGKRYDYRPNLLPTHRLAAVMRWEDHLQRNGGLLVGN